MCTCVHISVRKWCIVGYLSNTSCDLWDEWTYTPYAALTGEPWCVCWEYLTKRDLIITKLLQLEVLDIISRSTSSVHGFNTRSRYCYHSSMIPWHIEQKCHHKKLRCSDGVRFGVEMVALLWNLTGALSTAGSQFWLHKDDAQMRVH